MMMTIAFIGFGEAGGNLAGGLAREEAGNLGGCKANCPGGEGMGRESRGSGGAGGKSPGAGA
ncbi:6-phosphogluconate dehydrogenase, partial [Klebsiella pneumoniae]